MAELAAGPHATGDAEERARRQERLQRAEATFDPLPSGLPLYTGNPEDFREAAGMLEIVAARPST